MRLYRGIGAVLAGALMLALTATATPAQTAGNVADMLGDRVIGAADAPVTVVEYFSLTCPHCASFHNDTFAALKEKYVDTGKVRFIYRDYPLDGVGLRAAMMARCVNPLRYEGVIQVLFKTQPNWARARDPLAELGKIARLAGIDDTTFSDCVTSEELANGILEVRQTANAAGVERTPTFEINGQLYPGARSIEEFSEILDPLLANN